jgi:soluble lytic murein transglycosylase-like protein
MVNRMRRVLVCAVLAASGVVGVAPPAQAAQCAATYVVKAGDSWWRIAEKNNTNLRAILSLNDAKKSTKLLAGKTVCIPGVKQAPAPQQSVSRAKIIQIIRDAWPDNLEERALAIAQRESNLRPRVVNRSGCCYGLFQIYYRWHKTWLPSVGVRSAQDLLDPRLNAAAAYRLYQRNNGWGPWE